MAVKFGFFYGDNDCVDDDGVDLCSRRKFLDDDDDNDDGDAALIENKFSCHNNNLNNISSNDVNQNDIKKYVTALSLSTNSDSNNWYNQCINYMCLILYSIIIFVYCGCTAIKKRCGLFAVFILLLQLNGLLAVTAASNVGTGLTGELIISDHCKYIS